MIHSSQDIAKPKAGHEHVQFILLCLSLSLLHPMVTKNTTASNTMASTGDLSKKKIFQKWQERTFEPILTLTLTKVKKLRYVWPYPL